MNVRSNGREFVPEWLRERGLAWLVERGYATRTNGEQLRLTQHGRDWLLLALWIRGGMVGMEKEAYRE